jgi:hypothetical protein
MRVPVAARCVRLLSPQDQMKVFKAPILGNLFLDSQAERGYVD